MKNYSSQLLRLALPVVLSQAGQVSVMFADTVMVGQLGEVPLAAVSFAGNLTVPLIYLGGMAFCVTPLVGHRFGASRNKSIAFCLKQSRLFSLLVGVVQTLIGIALWTLIPFMGQDSGVVELSRSYMPILIASLLPAQIFLGYKQFVEGLHNTRLPMMISVVGNVLNIFLNYILIYGLGPIAAVGVNGAAWATLASRVLMWLAMEIVIRHNHLSSPFFEVQRRVPISWRAIKRLTAIGLPIGGQMVVECTTFCLGGIMMGWISTAAMAAHQAIITVICLTYMMAGGLSSAVTIKVSVSLGQRDVPSVVRYTRTALKQVVAFMFLVCITLVLGNEAIPRLIVDSEAVVAVAAQLMIIGGCFELFDGVQVVALGALRGMDDMRYPAIVSGVAYVATCIPMAYVLAFPVGLGANGIWIGFLLGLLVASVMLLLRVKKQISILRKDL